MPRHPSAVDRHTHLLQGVHGLGEDGLPVRPHKHDENDMVHQQVYNWKQKDINKSIITGVYLASYSQFAASLNINDIGVIQCNCFCFHWQIQNIQIIMSKSVSTHCHSL